MLAELTLAANDFIILLASASRSYLVGPPSLATQVSDIITLGAYFIYSADRDVVKSIFDHV